MYTQKELKPVQLLFSSAEGNKITLPEKIKAYYGDLFLLNEPGKCRVLANFVTSIDGVISLDSPGIADGGAISGYNANDAMIMGLLRAVSDVVIIGKGTLMASPNHLWIPGEIYPPFKQEYSTLRSSLDKELNPLTVLVTSEGSIEPFYRLFQTEEVPVLIITTIRGQETLQENDFPERISIVPVKDSGPINSLEILKAVKSFFPAETALVEGGPHLFESFLAEKTIDELFLTLAPQIAGRDESNPRRAMVENVIFNPGDPLWENLIDARLSGSHLFLRYSFH